MAEAVRERPKTKKKKKKPKEVHDYTEVLPENNEVAPVKPVEEAGKEPGEDLPAKNTVQETGKQEDITSVKDFQHDTTKSLSQEISDLASNTSGRFETVTNISIDKKLSEGENCEAVSAESKESEFEDNEDTFPSANDVDNETPPVSNESHSSQKMEQLEDNKNGTINHQEDSLDMHIDRTFQMGTTVVSTAEKVTHNQEAENEIQDELEDDLAFHRESEVLHVANGVEMNTDVSILEQTPISNMSNQGPVLNTIPDIIEVVPTAPMRSLPDVAISNSSSHLEQPSSGTQNVSLVPFTEAQLQSFYSNQTLLHIDFFIDEFIKNADKENSEFYELVLSYFKARKRFVDIMRRVHMLQTKSKSDKIDVWSVKPCVCVVKGVCGCRVAVEQEHRYQQAFFNKEKVDGIAKDLSTLRSLVNETCQLECYNCHVGNIRIDDYLVRLLNSPTIVQGLKADQSISASRPEDMSPEHITLLRSIQDCISVLFVFKRLSSLEKQFEEDLDQWLELLIAALQRVGTLPDMFFILNHLLRCPPSTIPKMVKFVQFPSFHENVTLPILDRPQIDHFIVMLATLALPVKARKEFLHKYRQESKAGPTQRSMSWTLVDENQEEEESSEDDWSFLTESDLISIFDQFPLTELLKSTLSVKKDYQGELQYTPSATSSNEMMRSFAFFSCLVNLLGQIFDTYHQVRYRNFTKTVSCNIRIITQVVSDHWLSYRQYRLNVVGDSYDGLPAGANLMLPQFSIDRLQVEFDQFFIRAAKRIMSSQSSGAMQFLSSMPFDAISSASVWIMLDLLVNVGVSSAGIASVPESSIQSIRSIDVSPSEGIFLLTALSNMAISRTSADQDFIEVVAKQILEISFLHPSLSELYTKNGHDMLMSLAVNHAFIVSTLLKYADENLERLRSNLVYIFEDLQLTKWKPSTRDLDILRKYLLECSLTSEESQLARCVLSHLNYSFNEGSKNLSLPRKVHYLVAILIVEAYGLCFPDYPGGIQKLDYGAMGIIGQVSQYAYSSYSKIMYNQVHSEFLKWAWQVMLSLKLHESDVCDGQNDEEVIMQGSPNSWVVKTLEQLNGKHSFDFDIDLTQELINVNIALQSKGLLAMYLTFAMTKYGHFVDVFLNTGVRYVTLLAEANQYDAIFRIISNLVPMFSNCPEKLAHESFVKILVQVIHIDVDNAGYREKLWQYYVTGPYSKKLAGMIAHQITQANDSNEVQAIKLIKLWMILLSRLPFWARDFGVLFQVDQLCKVGFLVKNGFNTLTEYFYEEFTSLVRSQEKKGLLSSVMSWISTNQIISLMPNLSGEFCFFAYIILHVEMRFEEEIKIWKELATELLMNEAKGIDQIYKKSLSNIKSLYVPPVNQLSIYRWSAQALLTPNYHHFAPFLWQHFFILFLRKQTEEDGIASRRGVGVRFFAGSTNNATLRKMKGHLYTLASYHQEQSMASNRSNSMESDASTEEEVRCHSSSFHEQLAKLYQGMALWLEESRVHDPNLYISSLPDAYLPHLLERIFQGKKDFWVEYIDMKLYRTETDQLAAMWYQTQSGGPSNAADNDREQLGNQIKVGQRIIRHLKNRSVSQPPPPVVFLQSPVEEVTYHTLLTRPRLLQDINHDLERFVRYAKTLSSLCASHVGLDSEYLELLPDLYDNVARNIVIGIPCNGNRRRRSGGECMAPAQVQIVVKELFLKQHISNLIEDNRAAFDKIIEKCTDNVSEELCIGAIHVENIITKLSNIYQHFNELQKQQLQGNARRLFYLLAQLIDDDVKRCYPAIQFFSSAIEMLGKGFIADNSTEQISLIDAILNHEASFMFLAPYFTPMTSLEHFAELYFKVVTILSHDKLTTVFVLLSKFDLNIWLLSKPSFQTVVEVASYIMDAMRIVGIQPNSEGIVVLELYRAHMVSILNNNLRQFFSRYLQSLLTASSQKAISEVCWNDLLLSIEYDTDEEDPLPYVVIKDAIEYMASFFYDHTDRVNFQLDLYYEIWENYTKTINQLLQRLFYSYIQQTVRLINECNKDQVLHELWETILSVYKPWVIPKTPGKIWTLLRSESVLSIVQSFTEVLRYVIDACTREMKYCVFMNFVWTFYFESVVPVVCEEQSLEIFHSMLATLPWSFFCPSVNELAFILQSHDTYPTAFRFLGPLLAEIDWLLVVESYSGSGNALAITRFHQHLVRIFVLMAANRTILSTSASKVTRLFNEAKAFHWETLAIEDVDHAWKWYANNCDAALILDKDSIAWPTLNLLHEVCGFSVNATDRVSSVLAEKKRNIYIQTIITMLGRTCKLKQETGNFRYVISKVLETIEKTVAFNSDNTVNELVLHTSTCLSLLNMVSNPTLSEIIKTTIEAHLFNTQCSMLMQAFISAVPRSVASLQEMVYLLETSIKCHFSRLSDDELKGSWHPICQSFVVPDLNIEDFIKEAIKQKAVLTLYAYNLRRISQVSEQRKEFDALIDSVSWCTKIQPDRESESKLMLLWLQIFDLAKVLLAVSATKSDLQHLSKYMIYLSHACRVNGEDKTYTGVLGAIGIGRRSLLSKEFRFSAKSVNLFILCQMPANAPLRHTATSQEPSNTTKLMPTSDAQKALINFQNLTKTKPYNSMSDEIKWVLNFVSDTKTTITNGSSLVSYLCKNFFDKENFISAAIL